MQNGGENSMTTAPRLQAPARFAENQSSKDSQLKVCVTDAYDDSATRSPNFVLLLSALR